MGKERLLALLGNYLEQNGGTVERYFAPLRPTQLVALYLPKSDLLFADSFFLDDTHAAALDLDEKRDWTQLFHKRAALARLDALVQSAEHKYARHWQTACLLQKDFARLDSARLNKEKLARAATRLAAKEFPSPSGHVGLETRRPLSGMSAGGMAAHFMTIAALCDTLVLVEDFSGAAGAFLLDRLRGYALGDGLDVIVCPSPLQPDAAPEFLFVPGIGLGAGVCNRFHNPALLIDALQGSKRFSRLRILRAERFYQPQTPDETRRRHFLHAAQWELLDTARTALTERDAALERLASLYAAANAPQNLPYLAAKLLTLAED
jgi:hypothetical protein